MGHKAGWAAARRLSRGSNICSSLMRVWVSAPPHQSLNPKALKSSSPTSQQTHPPTHRPPAPPPCPPQVDLDHPGNDLSLHPVSSYSPLERGLARLEGLSGVLPCCITQVGGLLGAARRGAAGAVGRVRCLGVEGRGAVGGVWGLAG